MTELQTSQAAGKGENTLEYQYQHLSPLDAFKAKGRYLHNQLKRERFPKSPDQTHNQERDSQEMEDAFVLDSRLHNRESQLASARTDRSDTSRYSDNSRYSDLSRAVSTSSIGSRNSMTTTYSEASTIEPNAFNSLGSYGGLGERNTSVVWPRVVIDRSHDNKTSLNNSDEDTGAHKTTSTPSHIPSSATASGTTNKDHYAQLGHRPSPVFHQVDTSPSQSPIEFSNLRISPASARGEKTVSSRTSGPSLHRKAGLQPSPVTSPLSTSDRVKSSRNTPVRALTYSPATSPNSSATMVDRSGRTPQSSQRPALRSSNRTSSLNQSSMASLPDSKLSAAVHIELGIAQHEANELPQSTHHFQVAADMGDPNGCMLYGLSLRHGWGIRQDLQRSVAMLQKAVESIDGDLKNGRESRLMSTPLTEEVAVAIYELGVSYKNGWGVPTDRKLALKYFELASSWGDVEAMVIAAECYLQGEGCKKDKTKAARYLRTAEEKGRKEIGNSWIWKTKYDG